MKNAFACVVGVVMLMAGLWYGRQSVAAEPKAIRSLPTMDYGVGDDVELYLDRSKSGDQVSLSGRIESIDGVQFCLRNRTTKLVAERPNRFTYRETLLWVPRSSVAWVQRVVVERDATTQPG